MINVSFNIKNTFGLRKADALSSYVAEFPPAAVARDQLAYATAEFSTYQTSRVKKGLNDAIQAALVGSKTPKEALSEAQELQFHFP